MDSPARSITKALTWQLLGLVVMTGLGWIATGSLSAAGGLALGAAATSFMFFIVHERIWARIAWGRAERQEGRT